MSKQNFEFGILYRLTRAGCSTMGNPTYKVTLTGVVGSQFGIASFKTQSNNGLNYDIQNIDRALCGKRVRLTLTRAGRITAIEDAAPFDAARECAELAALCQPSSADHAVRSL